MAKRRSARALVVHQNNILVMKRCRDGQVFYTLPGGGIEQGETPEAAAIREVFEETSIVVDSPVHFYDESTDHFGDQTYFVCRYVSGEPRLQASSEEARDTLMGSNTYEPMWLPIQELQTVDFKPNEALTVILDHLKSYN